MRVIEPRNQPVKETRQKRPVSPRLRRVLIACGVVFVSLALLSWWADRHPDQPIIALVKKDEPKQSQVTQKKTLQNFTADQFKHLYNTFAYPNTQEVTSPPQITGNPQADSRIQQLAEKRGYELRSIPVAPISKTYEKDLEGDDLLQPLALSGWQDLKAAAKKDSIPLRLLSGYRSIEYQRNLLVQRLSVAGAYTADIANGLADAKVDVVLSKTAPPGYSRHHTGYTIDLACYPNGGFVEFEKSSCFSWIKADNYKIAKENGWIPSYPNGTQKQGPEPEPWEYVWVGKDSLMK